MSEKSRSEIHVLYNARCPVCRAEIDHYQRYAVARGLPVVFHHLGTCDRASWGLDEDAAAGRPHVREGVCFRGAMPFSRRTLARVTLPECTDCAPIKPHDRRNLRVLMKCQEIRAIMQE